jgi:hypothetical protein
MGVSHDKGNKKQDLALIENNASDDSCGMFFAIRQARNSGRNDEGCHQCLHRTDQISGDCLLAHRAVCDMEEVKFI